MTYVTFRVRVLEVRPLNLAVVDRRYRQRLRGLFSVRVQLIPGVETWFVSDQIKDPAAVAVGDRVVPIQVTRWIAEAKGLV